MIKNIIFDLGGVVIDYNPFKVIPNYFTAEESEYILHNVFFTHEWDEIDRGVLTPAEGFEHCRPALGDEAYERLLDIVNNWGDYMPPFEDTFEFIKRLKAAGLGLYVLSNIPPYFNKMLKTLPALKYFDGYVISCEEKVIKPSPEIFDILLKRYSLTADECFFIDDVEKNAEGARKCGLHAHCFAKRDFNALTADLRALGVNI